MRLITKTVFGACFSFALIGCQPSEPQSQTGISANVEANVEAIQSNGNQFSDIVSLFDKDSFASAPKLVDCTLSGGSKTQCISITIKPKPANMKIGPWCPRNIIDGPEKSGIWLENGRVYDADGAFISNLPQFYKDEAWQMFDEKTGDINVTDSKISCEAAARPDVDEQYRNYCVECKVSYMDAGASRTFVIPIAPIKTQSENISRSGVGVALSGVTIDSSAPTHAILAAHTLAPFDDCGGHVNLHAGYHLHAITDSPDCLKEIHSDTNHAPTIGLALDGFLIHKQTDESLDICGGHESELHGYHYHAADAGKNKILACHTGETGCTLDSSSESCDASKSQKRGGPPRGGERPPKKG